MATIEDDQTLATTTCTFTVTVTDHIAPTLTCPANRTVNVAAGQCGAMVTYAHATSSDNCSSTVTYSQASGTFYPVGTTTITATATDPSGNTTTCTFTVRVIDNIAPMITCLGAITVGTDAGSCQAVVTYVPATATDNCSVASVTYNRASGSVFNLGTTQVRATATDASGRTATCSMAVTVVDDEAPSMGCLGDTSAMSYTGHYLLPDFASEVVTSDNCAGTVVVVQSPAPGTWYSSSQGITITLTATDVAGNTSTCSFHLDLRVRSCGVWYVDQSATGANTGWSWEDAFVDLTEALAFAAGNCDTIFVAEGTYYPTEDGSRDSSFHLVAHVPVYGGFPAGGSSFAQRNPTAHPSVLSGDMGTPGLSTDNSYRVVVARNQDTLNTDLSVFDGFVVTGAHSWGVGGGLYVAADSAKHSGLLVRNCIFEANETHLNGAGAGVVATNGGTCHAIFENCLFRSNTSDYQGGGLQVTAQRNAQVDLAIVHCDFMGNTANHPTSTGRGAGLALVANQASTLNAVLYGSDFTNNSTNGLGGGIYVYGSAGATLNHKLTYCTFTGNTAMVGGGMVNHAISSIIHGTVTGVQFTDNAATDGTGGGVHHYSEVNNGTLLEVTYEDCAFIGNTATTFGGAANVHGLKGGVADVTFHACAFRDNSANRRGGALYLSSSARLNNFTATQTRVAIDNCLFYHNAAPGIGTGITGQGGAIFQTTTSGGLATTTLRHCSFQANRAEQGGAVFNLAATGSPSIMHFRNTILWEHTTTITSSRMFHTSHPMGTIHLDHCLVHGASLPQVLTGNGCWNGSNLIFHQNPWFVDAHAGDLRLSAGSAAIDAGAQAFALRMDITGNTRTGSVDLGCYEFGGVLPRLAQAEETAAEPFLATLFPNPTSGTLTVSFDREITGLAQVFDLQGRVVASVPLNGAHRVLFELSGQASGLYLLRIASGNEVVTQQVVVKKL
jgi:hypothetical protein